jgi:hypothetical protein
VQALGVQNGWLGDLFGLWLWLVLEEGDMNLNGEGVWMQKELTDLAQSQGDKIQILGVRQAPGWCGRQGELLLHLPE